MGSGYDGGAGTLHANAPTDVPARLEALGLLGGLPRPALHAQVAAGLRVVLHLNRTGPFRSLAEICVLRPDADGLVRSVLAWHRDAGPGPGAVRGRVGDFIVDARLQPAQE